MSNFDPVSHASGIGAGEQIGRIKESSRTLAEKSRADIAEINAETNANIAAKRQEGAVGAVLAAAAAMVRVRELENEIANRWIPHGVSLTASILARRVEKQDLIDELKRLDPANAENVIRIASEKANAEYDRLTTTPAELEEINRTVEAESEAGRLG